jgi:hypothetical protein
MRASDGTIRLSMPNLSTTQQERRPATLPRREPGSLLGRWLGRGQPTTYQRCLAVHIHYAAPRSALS